jgi:tetratricopeptide (TPR) repeat protein
MKILHCITVSRLVVLAIIAGGVAAFISGAWPVTGIVLTFLGVIGGLLDHYSSGMREREVDGFFEAQAKLFARKGIGNLYTEAAKIEWEKGGGKQVVEKFQKALEIDPNDKEALASLGIMFALESSFDQWLKNSKGSGFHARLTAAKAYALKGKSLAPNDHIFCDVLGIIYDVEGNHEKARGEFRKSGTLRSDPYWHLMMSISYGMSGQHEQQLAEVRQAIKEGANSWYVDFCHGRALKDIGDYDQALPELKKAHRIHKWQVHVMRELIDAYYMQGHFGKAAKYAAFCSLALFRWFPVSSLRHFGEFIHHFLLYLFLGLSKRVWRISRHVPILKELHMRLCSPAQPWARLGIMLIERGHYRFAEKHLRKACDVLPDSPYLWANLCSCLALQNKRTEAIEKCDIAIRFAHDESLLAQLTQYKKNLESADYTEPKRIVHVGPGTNKIWRIRPVP